VLHERIDRRVEAMFAGGLLDEARALGARHGAAIPPKLPIGYAEALACLRGESTVEDAIRQVQVATRRYARRQVIWLRREPGVEWIVPPFDADALASRWRRG
jgi:tRNA dimethylallyltransferase